MSADDERDREGFSLAEATGGPLGLAEATVPFLAFTITWTATGKDVTAGAVVAVAITAVLALARIVRGETVQFALSGLFGVAIGAFVAARTGEAKNFFLPGILINAGSATAYLVSIAVRRPLIGLFAAALTGEGRSWYEDPERRELYTRASWIWVGLFLFRLGDPAAAVPVGRRRDPGGGTDRDRAAALRLRPLAHLPDAEADPRRADP